MPDTSISSRPFVESVGLSGDPLVNGLLYGVRYSTDANGAVDISFSIPGASSTFATSFNLGYGASDSEVNSGWHPVTASQADVLRQALDDIERYTNASFTEVSDTGTLAGTIRMAWTDYVDDETLAWAYYPTSAPVAGDIWLISGTLSESDAYFETTIYHELGHALGLKHPHEAEGKFPVLAAGYDGNDYTVMSYNVSARYSEALWTDLEPDGYMYLDIMALQALYGTDTVTTGRADTYNFDLSERHLTTIWDAGGIDTLSVTNGPDDVTISLIPGTWSDIGTVVTYSSRSTNYRENETVFIAPDTWIEKASGASGNDTLIGNKQANTLLGNAGDDTLRGGHSGDTLSGGDGDDRILGQQGFDRMYGDAGDDFLSGIWGADLLDGGAGDDRLIGGPGRDTIIGGTGHDTMTGGSEADTYIFADNSGGDRITDFDTSRDILDFSGLTGGFASEAAARAAMTQDSWGLVIDLGGGDWVRLVGLTSADANDVIVVV
ncbi:M10 family metallopeptidase C-terminal domain-containing protein [Gimibacter soli]|uniref:M10 family metallopeptidase C-terminal domain-containing protein n=1 Tax=Gimibacter soli TaxID=3024400 RepID=A0AAE9XL37_9PROT|nr:M10 family metallopeptidase C-terminal domain-containing protein [Gimibacter soli]WCL53164.1 M10 family metallopeptidase C-terminal domain-containing protein [Gimibacter soli]